MAAPALTMAAADSVTASSSGPAAQAPASTGNSPRDTPAPERLGDSDAALLAIYGDESPLDAAQARQLQALVEGYVTRLHGPQRKGQWDMVLEGQPFRVAPLAAWWRPHPAAPELWLALGARMPSGGHRLASGRLRLFVLAVDDHGQLVTRSRSPWLEEGTYGEPPFMGNPVRVGPQRFAFVSLTGETVMGTGVTMYRLRAPKGAGFQRLGVFRHQDYQGNNLPLWSEAIRLQARPGDESTPCWPLVAVRQRFLGNSLAGEMRRAWQRERSIPCNRFGTYGEIDLN